MGGCVGRSSCQPRPRGPVFLRLWEAASLSEHDTCRVRENDSMGCIHTYIGDVDKRRTHKRHVPNLC